MPSPKELLDFVGRVVVVPFGWPWKIISDRGWQFISSRWITTLWCNKSQAALGTPYHAQSDWQNEPTLGTMLEIL